MLKDVLHLKVLLPASPMESSQFFAVFSVAGDSDSGEFVVLVKQLGLSTSCSNFLKKLLQNSKRSQKSCSKVAY